MKKSFIVLLSVVTIIGLNKDAPNGNVVYASNATINVVGTDNSSAIAKGNSEKFRAEFAYQMAQITARIVSASTTNVENFKIEFAYATALVTAKVMPIIPSSQRNEFAYNMAQITTKIINEKNLDVNKAKAEYAYEIAQLTTKIITNADKTFTGNNTGSDQNTAFLRNNAELEAKATDRAAITANDKKEIVNTGYIAPETYSGLIDELLHVGDRSKQTDNKVNVDGELRYHYAVNGGSEQWDRSSAGIRGRLGFDTEINKDWHAYSMLDAQKSLVNYNNEIKLSRLYVAGKLGESKVRAGSFGYLMAEGNIYDSGFKGVKVDFGEPVKYTVSYGETDSTKKTYIATAHYNDFDYNLEAGVYHYQKDDGVHKQNTIRTLGGNYNFSNFGVGAMFLDSRLKDSNGDNKGFVFSLNYGDLKTYRPDTYGLFAKYYNQPSVTYIAHGMNGRGGSMQGFKGHGLGMNYTFAENLVGGIEYYDLTDKISGEKGETWWSHLTRYF